MSQKGVDSDCLADSRPTRKSYGEEAVYDGIDVTDDDVGKYNPGVNQLLKCIDKHWRLMQ